MPDWFSEGSIPAKAVNLLGEEKLLISPISAKITGAVALPTPGILSKWLSSLEYISFILCSNSSTWFSRKIIWLISCLTSKEHASPVN